MTTQELYELTRGHEGKPWWPADCQWAASGVCFDMWIGDEMTDNVDQIEALLIGSAVKWLVEKCACPECSTNGTGYFVVYWTDGPNGGYTEGTTLLAALLAACKAVEEGR